MTCTTASESMPTVATGASPIMWCYSSKHGRKVNLQYFLLHLIIYYFLLFYFIFQQMNFLKPYIVSYSLGNSSLQMILGLYGVAILRSIKENSIIIGKIFPVNDSQASASGFCVNGIHSDGCESYCIATYINSFSSE